MRRGEGRKSQEAARGGTEVSGSGAAAAASVPVELSRTQGTPA